MQNTQQLGAGIKRNMKLSTKSGLVKDKYIETLKAIIEDQGSQINNLDSRNHELMGEVMKLTDALIKIKLNEK